MRYLILSKGQAVTFISLLLVLIVGVISTVSVFAQGERQLPIYCVDTSDKKIAISFDAAWGADDTDTLIDILKQYNVKATFFVVGGWVNKYPEEVKKLSDNGHSVQNHSNSHPYLSKLSCENIAKEVEDCNAKIEAVTGKKPTLIRPPYGDYSNDVINTVNSLKMYAIQWSIDSHDWFENATAQSIAQRVTENAHPGGIILCHNDAKHTPEALPTILKTLQDEGYTFVLIEDLIYKQNYTIDHTGKQIKTNLQ